MEKRTLKVLSYNIHKGFSSGNRKFILSKIRAAIERVHPELVFLQEVQGRHDRHSAKISEWPTQPQFEYIADELWPHFAYGRNAVYTSGHHGNAILSKYPISFWENIDISTNRVESRGLLHGVIELPHRKKPLHAICVHLGLMETERQEQIRRICQRIESHVPHKDPLIIAGDFNDWRLKAVGKLEQNLEVEEAFREVNGNHARTFPVWMPALRLDRVYYRGGKVQQAECLSERPWNELSDHAALYVELKI